MKNPYTLNTKTPPLALPALIFLLSCCACHPADPESIPLPTKVCLQTVHHHLPVAETTVFIKYNTDTFPGYLRPETYWDTSFQTGVDGRGCFAPLPEGKHWFVALGYDGFVEVRGAFSLLFALDGTRAIDTTLNISE